VPFEQKPIGCDGIAEIKRKKKKAISLAWLTLLFVQEINYICFG
jgi:hypothetical protein